jgi:hypothetical protein
MDASNARSRLIAAIAVAAALGIGLLVLQRWVAETRGGAIALVGIWFAAVGIAALLAVRRRPELRAAVLGTYVAIAAASAVIGYWTGFRDSEVDEDVVMATAAASAADRQSALAGEDSELPSAQERERPAGPVELATGAFAGADGHAAAGRATVVREQDGGRILTFTDFDVDPGPGVVVYLSRDEGDVDDVIELGDLKGNLGDQQYEIPADADLAAYDTVILWCVPFTTRIAVAALG